MSIEQYEAHVYMIKTNMMASVEEVLRPYGLSVNSMAFQVGAPVATVVFLFCFCKLLKGLCCCFRSKNKVPLQVVHRLECSVFLPALPCPRLAAYAYSAARTRL